MNLRRPVHWRPARWLGAWALVALALLPARGHAQPQVYGAAALVNGQPITAERLERSFEEYLRERQINIGALRSPQRAKMLKRETLDLLIDQELLWQESLRVGALATPQEVQAAIEKIRAGFSTPAAFAARLQTEGYTEAPYTEHMRRLLSARKVLERASDGVTVSDAAVHEFYLRNQADFMRPEQRRLRHLYLPFAPEMDAARRADARRRAQALVAQLRDGADFAQLAREHSQGSSAVQGGDIGFVQREELAAPLAEAAFALAEGEVTSVVELPDGLHLLKVEQRVAAQRLPEADHRERIRQHLRAAQAQEARDATMKRLRAEAKIEVLVPLPAVSKQEEEPFAPGQRARALMRSR
ncbi:MAG: peptidylprolyl isomerase [Betaproteobacteria bacterium]|nr:peptidylprolyl isomerase [Betaproteobacteria bacterium]